MFSGRFRRERHNTDVEKADSKERDGESSHSRKLSSSDENNTSRTRPSKWGRLLGSSSLDSSNETGVNDTFKRSLSARDSRPSSSAGTNKVFPKLAKLGSTGGTIEEVNDTENLKESSSHVQNLSADSKQLSLRRLESYDGGLISQPNNDREILAAVLEVKVDLKLEVQRVNQRLAKIEDMLQTLMNRVSISSTPTSVAPAHNQSNSTVTHVQSSSSLSVGASTQGDSTEQKCVDSNKEQSVCDRLKFQEYTQTHSDRSKEVSERLMSCPSEFKAPKEVSKELLERLAQASTSRDDVNPLGPLILRKRRSKSRNKGAAPQAPLATQPVSPSDATETTQMLEPAEESVIASAEARTERLERSERLERKRPPPRPREYL